MTPHPHAAAARQLYDHRRVRDDVFGADRDGFGEPGWDMLLLLFARDAEGQPVSEDELVEAAGVPAALATPYLDWLISRGLARRDRDAQERWRKLVLIEPHGRELMTAYLERWNGAG